MARRYRYAIIKKKEAKKGKLSVGLAIASLLLFGAAVGTAYATLISVYGFLMGIASFSEENCNHRTSIVGTILNGVFLVGWLLFFLMGV